LGACDGQFNFPWGVATDSFGNIYVTDKYHRVQKFTPGGEFIMKWGGLGSAEGQLLYPKGIAVDSSGYVYVADTYNNRIQMFIPVYGYLRVTTSPALPSTILVNGTRRNDWGLDWVKVAPGKYVVAFTGVAGYTTPAPQTVSVTEGATATVTGAFTQLGYLRVTTNPAVPGTIYVDGEAMNDYGCWVSLPAGQYTVSFGQVPGRSGVVPASRTVTVAAGQTTEVTGNYP
jgi:hypothetical protein